MMIRERMRCEIQAEILQVAEEAAGIAHTGDRVQAPAAEVLGADATLPVEQVVEFVAVEGHPEALGCGEPLHVDFEPGCVREFSVDHDGMHRCKTGRRFAQWSCRMHPAVAES